MNIPRRKTDTCKKIASLVSIISALSLVTRERIIFPPLHIKLVLFKQFEKALNKNSPIFSFLQAPFPYLSNAKVEKGIFVGPQTQKVFLNDEFDKMSKKDEQVA